MMPGNRKSANYILKFTDSNLCTCGRMIYFVHMLRILHTTLTCSAVLPQVVHQTNTSRMFRPTEAICKVRRTICDDHGRRTADRNS